MRKTNRAVVIRNLTPKANWSIATAKMDDITKHISWWSNSRINTKLARHQGKRTQSLPKTETDFPQAIQNSKQLEIQPLIVLTNAVDWKSINDCFNKWCWSLPTSRRWINRWDRVDWRKDGPERFCLATHVFSDLIRYFLQSTPKKRALLSW